MISIVRLYTLFCFRTVSIIKQKVGFLLFYFMP